MRRAAVVFGALFILAAWAAPAPAAPGGGHGGGGGGGGGGKAITLSVAATQSVGENDADTMTVNITRSGSNISKCTTTVTASTADASARAGSDYQATSGVVTFLKGDTGAQFTIPLVNDAVPEGNETFTVTLSSASSTCRGSTTTIANTTQTVTITDSDVAFTVPAGKTAYLSGMALSGCDTITALLDTPAGNVALGDNAGNECTTSPSNPADTHWTNDTTTDAVVTVALEDHACPGASAGFTTYSSDTTTLVDGNVVPVNHANVTPTSAAGSWTVDIADGQALCSTSFLTPSPGTGNFTGTLRIGDPPLPPPPPPSGGQFFLNPGQTATVNWFLATCDSGTVDVLNGGAATEIAGSSSGGDCSGSPQSSSTTVTNDTTSVQGYLLDLVDTSCNGTYRSDGAGTANHATAAGTNPYQIDINDGGGAPDCPTVATDNQPPTYTGNLSVYVNLP